MNDMKKITSILLIFILVFSLLSCGSYNPALNKPGEGNSNTPGAVEQPGLDDDPTNDFTVRLRQDGEFYIPTVGVNVYWNDGYSIYAAPVDENGVATIDGLDGDYKVTLEWLSDSGKTYNPNAYTATNDKRDIIIDVSNSGTYTVEGDNGLYSAHQISEGVFTVRLYDKSGDGSDVDVVYFDFIPKTNGIYTIESWVDTSDDEINPVCIAYASSSVAYKGSPYRVGEVGACGSYTRNFVYTVNIANENIAANGAHCFAFGITAETKSGNYPAAITFEVKRQDSFGYDSPDKLTIAPTFRWDADKLAEFKALAGTNKVGAAVSITGAEDEDGKMFVEKDPKTGKVYYKEWKKEDGGDGFYHVYDKDNPEYTDGYGPILFAYINEPCAYMEGVAIVNVEDPGNNALVVNSGTENYRQFIKGFAAVAEKGFYCTLDCPYYMNWPETYSEYSALKNHTRSCRLCPESLYQKEGYADWCNDDGVVPVTPELKEFLQKFAESGYYFVDGEGYIDQNGVFAYEDAQWLFACGYYEPAE